VSSHDESVTDRARTRGLLETRSGVPSGHADDSIGRHGVLDAGVAFVSKPITPDALLGKVREVLDSR